MNRRDFVRSAATVGVAGGLANPAEALSSDTAGQRSRLVVDGLDTSFVNEGFLELLRIGGVDCVHKSLYGVLPSYGSIFKFLDEHANEIVLATTVQQIRQAKRDGKISIVFGIQECNWLEEMFSKTADGTLAPFSALRASYELGLRVLGIAYQATNMFGGGGVDDHVGLTRAGRLLVEEIHSLGMILDVGGHLGEQTSLDAIEVSFGVPIICSHTNMAALNDNIRAISDRLAEAIAGTGGVIGLTALSDFHVRNAESYKEHGRVSPQATLDMHLDQYDYLRDLVGINHVGLGPDFVWGNEPPYHHVAEISLTFPPEASSLGPIRMVKDFENISQLPNLIRGLEGRGWSQEELDKVLGGNWLRVYEQVWGA